MEQAGKLELRNPACFSSIQDLNVLLSRIIFYGFQNVTRSHLFMLRTEVFILVKYAKCLSSLLHPTPAKYFKYQMFNIDFQHFFESFFAIGININTNIM